MRRMQHPLVNLLAALATGGCALGSAWQGLAGWSRGVVLVFKRSGSETHAVQADNPSLFWFCVLGWFVLCATFAWLCRRYWRAYAAA